VSGHVVLSGNRGEIEFLNVAAKDADLSLNGEIDFENADNVAIKMTGAMPIFDLTEYPVGCTEKIELTSAPFTFAPPIGELQFRGGLFQLNWTVGLKERTIAESFYTPDPNGLSREFPLCFAGPGPEQSILVLGVLPTSEAHPANAPRPGKRGKRNR
jgi:hypothetical protein